MLVPHTGTRRAAVSSFRAAGKDAGSAALESVMVAVAALLFITTVIAVARLAIAGQAIQSAAAEAARQASLARSASAAQEEGRQTADRLLTQDGVTCTDRLIEVDTSGFRVPVGRSADVHAEIRCEVDLSDVAVPGLPGRRTLEARATSPLDRFRLRS